MPRSRLEVVAVHHALGDLLVLAEGAALAQQLVDQRGLAVVDVGDDGDVADLRVMRWSRFRSRESSLRTSSGLSSRSAISSPAVMWALPRKALGLRGRRRAPRGASASRTRRRKPRQEAAGVVGVAGVPAGQSASSASAGSSSASRSASSAPRARRASPHRATSSAPAGGAAQRRQVGAAAERLADVLGQRADVGALAAARRRSPAMSRRRSRRRRCAWIVTRARRALDLDAGARVVVQRLAVVLQRASASAALARSRRRSCAQAALDRRARSTRDRPLARAPSPSASPVRRASRPAAASRGSACRRRG